MSSRGVALSFPYKACEKSLFFAKFSLLLFAGKFFVEARFYWPITLSAIADSADFPVIFPVSRELVCIATHIPLRRQPV